MDHYYLQNFPLIEAMREKLIALSEPEYQTFTAKLLPGVEHILGVRLPLLRKEAKELAKGNWRAYREQVRFFPDNLFFEEIMLEGMMIGQLRPTNDLPPEAIFSLIADFIPKISNWSVCDSFCSGLKITKKYPVEMWDLLTPYLKSSQEYQVRFAAVLLLDYYIDEAHIHQVIRLLDGISHPGYYAKMAAAWALSMCYVKFPETTFSYLQGNHNLDDFTYKKTIQKTIESLKVGKEEKEKLRALKR